MSEPINPNPEEEAAAKAAADEAAAKAAADEAAAKAAADEAAAKAAADKPAKAKAAKAPKAKDDPPVSVVLTTSRYTDPATSLQVARDRIATVRESRVAELTELGHVRAATPADLKAAQLPVVDLTAI